MRLRPLACLFAASLVLSAHAYEVVRDVAYDAALGLRLDLYLPDSGSGPFPTVVYIHGGGWQNGSKNSIGDHIKNLADRGYVVASINYRLSGVAVWPAQIHDCKGALRWLRANAPAYRIDPARIGVWGPSAGGHLAAYMMVSNGVRTVTVGGETVDVEGSTGGNVLFSSDVQCAVNYFGPSDLLKMSEQGFPNSSDDDVASSGISRLIGNPVQETPDRTATASPVTLASSDDGPILHVHGTVDGTVPFRQSVVFHDALARVGARSQLWPVLGAGHGGTQFATPPVLNAVYAFLDKHLQGIGPAGPSTRIAVTPTTGFLPLTVRALGFEPVSRLRFSPYLLSFGDGFVASANAAEQTYTSTGTFAATLSTVGTGLPIQTDLARVVVTVPGAGAAGVFRVAKSQKRVREADGATWIRVYRELGTQEGATVRIRTVADTAQAGTDFVPIDETLTFAEGETVKVVKVTLIDDGLPEGPESFSVELGAPGGGGVLGAPTRSTILIGAH